MSIPLAIRKALNGANLRNAYLSGADLSDGRTDQ